jgi:two-component system phosphate regulon response regulator PhoB
MPSDCVGADMAARLLLVDDYRDALEMWAIYLRARGYDIDTASDGKTAVRLAIETRPDLIVMDLVLPGISGCEAARQLRARPETARIPIIATTGNTHPDELDRARRAGFVSIMIKPCDPPGLVGEIERILRTGADEASQAGARPTVH